MKNNIIHDPKSIIRRILFFTILIALAITYLTFTFKGLSSRVAMDQAQIAREVARGHGLTTKFIRPLAIHQLDEDKKDINLNHFYDTTHAPLNILVYAGVLKMFGADDPERYSMTTDQDIYQPDRIIAGTCLTFFLIAIAINFALVSKIFDTKIASMVAILMLASESFWSYSMSGLPQMLMLAIFSGACYFIWTAISAQEAGRSPMPALIVAGFMFGLLALAHWLTLWIFVGFLMFTVSYFRPRGVITIMLMGMMLLFIAAPLAFYANHSDGFMGTAFYYVQGKVGIAQDNMFRSLENPRMDVRDLLFSTIRTTLLQAHEIHRHLGGFVLATGFFLSLLHPFKRSSISHFRWCIFIMWIFASFGMAIYGLTSMPNDPNQLHILFMPLMSAYALALVSILWNRLPISQQGGAISLLPFIIIIIVTASPMLISLEQNIKQYTAHIIGGYYPNNNNRELPKYIKPTQMIYSDQPWAVAWYADRIAIWSPIKRDDYDEISKKAGKLLIGFHRSPLASRLDPLASKHIAKEFPHRIPLVLDPSKKGLPYYASFMLRLKEKPKVKTEEEEKNN